MASSRAISAGGNLIRVAVIGCGHWGPNHIRIFSNLSDSRVTMCADLSPQRLSSLKNLFPQVHTTSDYQEIIKHPEVDAICIATPTDTHFKMTEEALQNGKHVLCEKPLATTSEQCQRLNALASMHKKILMVGHVFIFHAGIVQLKEYIKAGEIGKIYYAHSQRTNLGPFRYDVNALWDLAPHDIAIFNYLFNRCPVNVSARGQKYLGPSREDLAFATLEYPPNVLVNVHVSWLDPRKVRQITIVGDKKMVVWDDLDNLGPIKLYDKHVEKTAAFYDTYGDFQLLSKEGSITIPKVSAIEPLKVQDQYFLDCIKKETPPALSNAQTGIDVVKTLAAIQKSMDQNGVPVEIS